MRIMVGLTAPTSGSVTISGRRFADLPNPGPEVGVLLDASAQHAGRTGREILVGGQVADHHHVEHATQNLSAPRKRR